jgi:cobalamin biosynthesis protein CobD/CbiB
MTTVELRQQAKSMIDAMSARDLHLVREFLAFVVSRDTNAATRELLAIPGFETSFVRGVKDIRANRVKPWRRVRSDV